jgi:hypothetical protein
MKRKVSSRLPENPGGAGKMKEAFIREYEIRTVSMGRFTPKE